MSKSFDHVVQFYETDGMRIVHHSNYLRWFEEARMWWLEDLGFGYDQMEEEGISIPVVSANLDYKQPMRFGDTAQISMIISKFSSVRFYVDYRIENKATGQVTTLGQTEHCFIDNETGRPISVKRNHANIYQIFQTAYEASK